MNNKPSSQPYKIDRALRAAYSELQATCMVGRLWSEMPNLAQLTGEIFLSADEVAVLAITYVQGETMLQVDDKVYKNLLQFHFEANGVRARNVMKRMSTSGIIDLHRDRETGSASYSLSHETERAIDEDDTKGFKGSAPQGLDAMLQYVTRRLLDRDHLVPRQFNDYLEMAKRHNRNLAVVKFMEDTMLFGGPEEEFTLLAICARAAIENESFNFVYLDTYIHIDRGDIQRLRQEILDGEWLPIKKGLVEVTGSNIMEFNPDLQLTEAGFDLFLGELDPAILKMIRRKMASVRTPLIQPEEVHKVQLHFSPTLQRKTERIAKLLSVKGFREYQQGQSRNERMKGITLLFHGGPGCGKTEFALQLAKLTGRPVMKIQVTDFMSKWVGDSEANLKRIFSDYRKMWDRLEVKPILFLNECDQIIGKRLNATRSVDQMQNGLQNLVLEEMETFGGILIGTT
ncbi:MAG: ATP-binding protein, partial [Sphingomonadales bacterium]